MTLEYSETFGRPMRRGNWDDLKSSDFTKMLEAIDRGDTPDLIALLHYVRSTSTDLLTFLREWSSGILVDMATQHGEAYIERMWRFAGKVVKPPYEQIDVDVSPETLVWLLAEMTRALSEDGIDSSSFTIKEEADRYVFDMFPCPTGGKLAQKAASDPALVLGTTKEAHPWSWGQEGVPYYCCHNAIVPEMMAIEQQGYPAIVTECGAIGNGTCRKFIYKHPADIPAKYFERVGHTKDEGRFRKMSEGDDPIHPVTLVSW